MNLNTVHAAVLKSPDPNFYYFAGIEFEQAEGSLLMLKRRGKPVVVASCLDKGNIPSNRKIGVIEFSSREQLQKILSKELKGKRVGYNSAGISKQSFDALRKAAKAKKWVDLSKELGAEREVKSSREIGKINKAVNVTERILKKMHSIFRNGMTERELALELQCLALKKKAQGLAFPTIVASGARGKTPHYITADKKIGNGFLLIDFGIRIGNYCSDLSRTFYVGKAGKEERELYGGVFRTKEFAAGRIREGEKCGKIFQEAGKFLENETGFTLLHGLGHGLGLEVHDFPKGLVKDNSTVIRKGMVFTVEPAVYGKFGGIRIEDVVAVGTGKCRKLSAAPKQLIEL